MCLPKNQTLKALACAIICILILVAPNSCEKTTPKAPDVTVVQRYQVRARIISLKSYSTPDDYWAPIDAVLAWGPLLDPESTKRVTFLQEGRWYHAYTPAGSDPKIVAHHTANTHLIADSPETRKLILSLKEGKTYFLEGALVNTRLSETKEMRSSTSRTDSGKGACEVFLLKKATPVD